MPTTRSPGVLCLENGLEFEGTLFGAAPDPENGRGYGEMVFNTSLTGYQEILTDPSYFGQMICMTAPHIGNTGLNDLDQESGRIWTSGFIVHDLCEVPSSWRSERPLEPTLKEAGVTGLMGVDTRALTRGIRSQGVVRGVILPLERKGEAKALLARLPGFEGRDLIREVSTKQRYVWPAEGQKKYRVAALDYGAKRGLFRNLAQLGCELEVFPATATSKEVLSIDPDGVFLSNGPGDPAGAPYAARTVREILGKVPLFGVCMGHQILALAIGGRTYKMKFGHRGGNQPVMDQATGKVEISSQNHGYAVDPGSVRENAEISHLNLNDRTVEGLNVPPGKFGPCGAFSVQHHPEACPGPHDSAGLFKRFVEAMDRGKASPLV